MEREELKQIMERFRRDFISELLPLLKQANPISEKKWLKSNEVKKLLCISHGKLQTMRNAKVITFTRIGGTIFYDRDEIEEMFERNKVQRKQGRM